MKCSDDQCDFEPTDGLLDRNGYETRKCCNCGDVAEFFVFDLNECDEPDPWGRDDLNEHERNLEFGGLS